MTRNLGIDLGPNSIGWALVNAGDNGSPCLITTGVRVFESGLADLETDAKGVSRNLQRRQARAVRRLTERRVRRLRKIASTLQTGGLLPEGSLNDGLDRHLFFNRFDTSHDSPYQLRAQALDQHIELFELGRILYHIGQRRGFLSNRKSQPRKNEKPGVVKSKIEGLEKAIAEAGARTLGEYFSGLDPEQERIRERYTSRAMYEEEFKLIWNKQSEFYPGVLTEAFREKVYKAIFYQRPLKNQKNLIGQCELEPQRKRAPWDLLISQRFRYLQKINNLRIEDTIRRQFRELTTDERTVIVDNLETGGDLTFAGMRKLIGVSRNTHFNLELGGEKKVPGNRTAAKLISIFGLEKWQSFTESEKEQIVEDVRCFVKEEALKKRGMKAWGLNEEAAAKLSQISLEDKHIGFSRQAMTRLMPYLERGVPLQTAIKECYPDRWNRDGQPREFLPPVRSEELTELRNPIVERALTELRRVVNTVIMKYGKPDVVRIELGRELRQSPKQRESTWKSMRSREKERKAAAERIANEMGIENPTRTDILKVLLAEECNWRCPYTDKPISMASLLGDHPQFDIEHIVPFERCLDDSFLNKTLCDAEENRKVKKNRTPYEAYHGSPRWEAILKNVGAFNGTASYEKERRFQFTSDDVQEFISGFTSRQLNDTRWASKWAKQYIGLLYGNVNADGIDAENRRRVQATTGPVTAFLRSVWGLNGILSDGPAKSRDDHRHHAIDALVIALADSAIVKQLNDAASRAGVAHQRLFEKMDLPWDGFVRDVESAVGNLVVSHRVSRRVRGALHEETFYSEPRLDEKGKSFVHIRKPLSALDENNIDEIVDPAVREAVKTKLAEFNDKPKKVFAVPENLPTLARPDGRRVPIRRARIRRDLSAVFSIGEGHRRRYVMTDRNHHIEYVEVSVKEGVVRWEAEVVSMLEAYRRLKSGEPVVKRDHGSDKRFLFSLAGGEIIELGPIEGNGRGLYVVRTVPQSKQLFFVPINDARKLKEIPKAGHTAVPDALRLRKCRKVTVTPLGEVRFAND